MKSDQKKLSIKSLNHVYNKDSKDNKDVMALKDIDLTISTNEIVSIIGPSGCGKTTFLMIMAGLITPYTGTIMVDGKEVCGPGRDRAVVFQQDAVFPWLTVEENIEYGLKIGNIDKEKRKERVRQYIKLVGLEGFEKQYPKALSGGMKKRVDIARAYANRPDILLMDEPFGSLDAITKGNMQLELLRLWEKEKKTICFVTHDIEEAIFLSHKIIILSSRPGTIKEIFELPFKGKRDMDLKLTNEFQEIRRTIRDIFTKI